MNKTYQKKPDYSNIGFLTGVFALVFLFAKEYLLHDLGVMGGALAGLVSICASLPVYLFMKKYGILPKVLGIAGLIGFIFVFAQIKNNNTSALLCSKWITNDNEMVLTADIDDTEIHLAMPDDDYNELFKYRLYNNTLTLYNEEGEEEYKWEIKELTADSLIILEDNEDLLRFKKQ